MNDTQRAKTCILPLATALYRACIDQRGAVGAIAQINGLNPNTLALKINPNREGHHLNPSDIEAITAYTRDGRILDSMCEAYGNAVWFETPELDAAPNPRDLLKLYTDIGLEFANIGRRLFEATADQNINPDELSALKKTAAQMHRVVACLVHAAEVYSK